MRSLLLTSPCLSQIYYMAARHISPGDLAVKKNYRVIKKRTLSGIVNSFREFGVY